MVGSIGRIIQGITTGLEGFRSIKLQHTKWENNTVAHELAKLEKNKGTDNVASTASRLSWAIVYWGFKWSMVNRNFYSGYVWIPLILLKLKTYY